MGEEGRREEERGKGRREGGRKRGAKGGGKEGGREGQREEGRKEGDQILVTVLCSIHDLHRRVPNVAACTHFASATCVW